MQYHGLHEQRDNKQLQDILSINPRTTQWCAAFVNAILTLNEIPNLNDINHTYPLTARAFLQWGNRVEPSEIKQGDIVVFPRGPKPWEGHVGFYYGSTAEGQWVILGGNQRNSVRFDLYTPNRALGIRRWNQ